jgi:hypothetical protein
MPRPLAIAMFLAAAVSGGSGVGCVQRTIHIDSSPSGALVYLNDQEVGRTPVSVPFTFYGVYDVRLEAEGHRPLWTEATAEMPWWEYPGPDLIAEMIPGAKSDVRWDFELEPAIDAEDVDVPALVNRAEAMQRETRDFRGE